MRQLEFSAEEARADAAHKSRQLQDLQQSVADMKSQMNDIREQKNNCENEASLALTIVSYERAAAQLYGIANIRIGYV